MAKPRWDIRAEAARMIGNKTEWTEANEHIKVRESLRKKFPGTAIDTIRSAIAWVLLSNRKDNQN